MRESSPGRVCYGAVDGVLHEGRIEKPSAVLEEDGFLINTSQLGGRLRFVETLNLSAQEHHWQNSQQQLTPVFVQRACSSKKRTHASEE